MGPGFICKGESVGPCLREFFDIKKKKKKKKKKKIVSI
jgi:hypothetical protein